MSGWIFKNGGESKLGGEGGKKKELLRRLNVKEDAVIV